ncbi:hypothetical protein N7507_009262 [Penicillium longicatenatum]|nr:hypothetical protein N7507_009262 [Penicillium longicatenatum]
MDKSMIWGPTPNHQRIHALGGDETIIAQSPRHILCGFIGQGPLVPTDSSASSSHIAPGAARR